MSKVIKDIRVSLTDSEKAKIGGEIAQHVMRAEALEDQKRIVTGDLRSEINDERKAYRTKAKALRDGHEYRPIECEEVPNFDRNEVIVRRVDTGEVIDTRAMTATERQTQLDLGDEKSAPVVSIERGKGKRAKVEPVGDPNAH